MTWFNVHRSFLDHEVYYVGGEAILQDSRPVKDLGAPQDTIVCKIELVAEFH